MLVMVGIGLMGCSVFQEHNDPQLIGTWYHGSYIFDGGRVYYSFYYDGTGSIVFNQIGNQERWETAWRTRNSELTVINITSGGDQNTTSYRIEICQVTQYHRFLYLTLDGQTVRFTSESNPPQLPDNSQFAQ